MDVDVSCNSCKEFAASIAAKDRHVNDLKLQLSTQKLKSKARLAQLKQTLLDNLNPNDATAVLIARLEEAESELVNYRAKIDDLQDALQANEVKLKDHVIKIKTLESQSVSAVDVNDNHSTLRALNSSLPAVASKCTNGDASESDQDDLELSKMYAQMVYKDSKIMELNNALVDKDNVILDLQESLREKDEVIRSKVKAIQIFQEQLQAVDGFLDQLALSTDSAGANAGAHSSELSHLPLVNRLALLTSRIDGLQKAYRRSSTMNTSLNSSSDVASAETTPISASKAKKKKVTFDLSEIERQNEIDSLRKELKDAEAKRRSLQVDNEELHSEVDHLKAELDRSSATLDKQSTEIDSLKMQVDANFVQAQRALEQMDTQAKEWQNKLLKAKAQSQSKIQELEERLNALQQQLAARCCDTSDAEVMVDLQSNELQHLLQKSLELEDQLQQSAAAEKSLTDTIDALQAENIDLNEDVCALRRDIDRLIEENEDLLVDLKRLRQERNVVSDHQQEFVDEIGEMKETIDVSDRLIKVLEEDLDASKQQVSVMERKVADYDQFLAELQSKQTAIKSQLEKELTEFKLKNKAAAAKIRQLEQENEELDRELAILKEHFQSLLADSDSLASENVTSTEEIARLKEEAAALRSSMEQANAERDAATQLAQELSTKLTLSNSQTSQLNRDYSLSSGELLEVQSELDLARATIAELEQRLAELSAVRDSFGEEKQDIESELHKLWSNDAALKKQLAESDAFNEQLLSAVKEQQERLGFFEKQDQEATAKINRLLIENAKLTKLKLQLIDEAEVLKSSASDQQVQLSKRHGEYRARIGELETNCEALSEKCSRLEQSLSEAELSKVENAKECGHLSDELAKQSENLRQKSEACEMLQNSVSELQLKVNHLQHDLAAKLASLNSAQHAAGQLQHELAQTKASSNAQLCVIQQVVGALRTDFATLCDDCLTLLPSFSSELFATSHAAERFCEEFLAAFEDKWRQKISRIQLQIEANQKIASSLLANESAQEAQRRHLATLRSENDELQTALEDRDAKLLVLQNENMELLLNLQKLTEPTSVAAEDDGQQTIAELREAVKELTDERSKLLEARQSLCQEIVNLNAALADAMQSKGSQLMQPDGFASLVHADSALLADGNVDIDGLNDSIESLMRENDHLAELLKDEKDRSDRLCTENAGLRLKVDELQSAADSATSEIQTFQEMRKQRDLALAEENNLLRVQNEELQCSSDRIAELEQKLQDVEQRLGSEQSKSTQTNSRLQMLMKQNEELSACLDLASTKLDSCAQILEEKTVQWQNQLSQLSSELSDERLRSDALEAQLRQCSSEIESNRLTKEEPSFPAQLSHELSEAKERKDRLEQQLKLVNEEKQEFKTKLDSTIEQLIEVEQQRQDSLRRTADLEERFGEMESENARLTQKLSEAMDNQLALSESDANSQQSKSLEVTVSDAVAQTVEIAAPISSGFSSAVKATLRMLMDQVDRLKEEKAELAKFTNSENQQLLLGMSEVHFAIARLHKIHHQTISGLQNQLSQTKEELVNAKDDLIKSRDSIETLEHNMVIQMAENERLSEQLQMTNAQLNAQLKLAEDLEQSSARLHGQNSLLLSSKSELEQQLSSANEQRELLEASLKQSEEHEDNSASELRSLLRQLRDSQRELETARDDLAANASASETLQSEMLAKFEAEKFMIIESWQTQLDASSSECEQLKSAYAQLAQYYGQAKEAYDLAYQQYQLLAVEHQRTLEELKVRTAEVDESKREIAALIVELTPLRETLQDEAILRSEMQAQIEMLSDSNEKSSQEIARLQELNVHLNNAASHSDPDELLRAELSELRGQLSDSERHSKTLKSELDGKKRLNVEESRERERLMQEIEERTKENDELRSKLCDASERISAAAEHSQAGQKFQEELTELRSRLAEAEDHVQATESQLEELRSLRSEETRRCESLSQEIHGKMNENEALQVELLQATERLTVAEDSLRSLRTENEHLQDELKQQQDARQSEYDQYKFELKQREDAFFSEHQQFESQLSAQNGKLLTTERALRELQLKAEQTQAQIDSLQSASQESFQMQRNVAEVSEREVFSLQHKLDLLQSELAKEHDNVERKNTECSELSARMAALSEAYTKSVERVNELEQLHRSTLDTSSRLEMELKLQSSKREDEVRVQKTALEEAVNNQAAAQQELVRSLQTKLSSVEQQHANAVEESVLLRRECEHQSDSLQHECDRFKRLLAEEESRRLAAEVRLAELNSKRQGELDAEELRHKAFVGEEASKRRDCLAQMESEFSNKIGLLEAELRSASDLCDRQNAEFEAVVSEKCELMERVDAYRETVGNLQQALNVLESELRTSASEQQAMLSQMQAERQIERNELRSECEELRSLVAAFENEKESWSLEMGKLSSAIDALIAEKTELEHRVSSLKAEIQQSAIVGALQGNETAKSDSPLSADFEAMKINYETAIDDLMLQSSQCADLGSENSNLRLRCSELANDLDSAVEKADAERHELQELLRQKSDQLTSIEKKSQTSREQLDGCLLKVDQYGHALAEKNAENCRLVELCQAVQQKIEEAGVEIEKLRDEVKALKASAVDANVLRDALSQVHGNLETLSHEKKLSDESAAAFKQECDSRQSTISKFERLQASVVNMARLFGVAATVDDSEQLLQKCAEAYAELQTRYTDLWHHASQWKHCESESVQFKADLHEANAAARQLHQKASALEDERRSALMEIDGLKRERVSLLETSEEQQRALGYAEESLHAAREEIALLRKGEKDCAGVRNQLTDSEHNLALLRSELETISAENDSLQNVLTASKLEHKVAQERIVTLQQHLAACEQKLSQLQQQATAVSTENEQLWQRVHASEKERADLHKRLLDSMNKLQLLEQERQQFQASQNEIEELRLRIGEFVFVQRENEDLRDRMNALNRHLNSMELKIAERDILYEKLREAELQVERLVVDKRELAKVNNQQSEQIRMQMEERRHLKGELDQLRTKMANVSMLEERLTFTETQLSMFASKNAQLEQMLEETSASDDVSSLSKPKRSQRSGRASSPFADSDERQPLTMEDEALPYSIRGGLANFVRPKPLCNFLRPNLHHLMLFLRRRPRVANLLRLTVIIYLCFLHVAVAYYCWI